MRFKVLLQILAVALLGSMATLAPKAFAGIDRNGDSTVAPRGASPGGPRQILVTDAGQQLTAETANGSLVTTRTAVSSSSPTLVCPGLAGRLGVLVQNFGATDIYCAGASTLPDGGALTTSVGTFRVTAGSERPLGVGPGIPIYCLADTADQVSPKDTACVEAN